MELSTVIVIVGLLGTISGIALGWLGKAKQSKSEAHDDGKRDASLDLGIEYIKRGVDDLRVDYKLQGQKYDEKFEKYSERIVIVEESNKSAHKRIDALEK